MLFYIQRAKDVVHVDVPYESAAYVDVSYVDVSYVDVALCSYYCNSPTVNQAPPAAASCCRLI